MKFEISQENWRKKKKKIKSKIVLVEETTESFTAMDKSVNNFDEVEDTMSSVYNAWRKKSKLSEPRKLKIHTLIFPSFSSLGCFVGFFQQTFGTYLISIIPSNNENTFFIPTSRLFDQNHKFVSLTTPNPNNTLFTDFSQTKCWSRRILVWPNGSTIWSVKCSSSKKKSCPWSRHCRKCWDDSTISIAIHHAYHRQRPPPALMKLQ